MAQITTFKGYAGNPPFPKPAEPVLPNIVRVQDGVPVRYPGCDGLGVRVVHPVNPKAPAQNLGLVMFYVPPHVVLEPGNHETEETYVILEGKAGVTQDGELFSIPSKAARPPKLAPYPVLVGTAMTGLSTRPATTLGNAPSIPATTMTAAHSRSRSVSTRRR